MNFFANFKSLGDMITGSKGIGSVAATGVMFIFSILFFGILTDAGTFRPIIKGILNLVGTDPVKIGIGTAILAAIVHLDGSGAVTFLICVPALLPLYDALGMRRTTLATIVALSAGTMNILPWGGPTIRAHTALATMAGTEATVTGFLCQSSPPYWQAWFACWSSPPSLARVRRSASAPWPFRPPDMPSRSLRTNRKPSFAPACSG